MEDKISLTDKADNVLKFLATSPFAKPLITFDDIHKHTPFDQQAYVLKQIIEQLEKDEYISQEIREENYNGENRKMTYYKITLKGEFFSNLGGYNYLTLEKASLDELKNQNKKISKQMLCLTRIIAFGTLIAAVYYGIEIIKFLHHHFCH